MGKLMKKMAILAATAVAALSAFFVVPLTSMVSAEESGTVSVSDVMTDLQKDATFSAEDYPEKSIIELRSAGEEYLQLIKIAESVNDELYLYVYQPSDSTTELTATMVNMGQTTTDSGARIYPLRLVSTEGVFDKYLVEGLEVLDFEVRNYTVVSLYRAWQKGVDADTETDNKDSSVAHAVGQTWYARTTENGDVEYAYIYEDVITITSEWHGEIDISDGSTGTVGYGTTSHFIAFTTDHKIDELKTVEITYKLRYVDWQSCLACDNPYQTNEVKDLGRQYIKLYATDIDENNPTGLFPSKKYSWDKINTVDSFLTAEGDKLSLTAKNELNRIKDAAGDKGSFVLRFLSTEYESSSDFHWVWFGNLLDHMVLRYKEYRVSDAAIIRLSYETNSVPYTLGVVDSMTTSDGVSDNGNAGEVDTLSKKINQLGQAIGLMFGAIALGFIIYFIVLLVSKLVAFIKAHPINFGGGSGGDNNKTGTG